MFYGETKDVHATFRRLDGLERDIIHGIGLSSIVPMLSSDCLLICPIACIILIDIFDGR